MVNIVRTPQTHPLSTITREDSPALNRMFIDFLNNVETNSKKRQMYIKSPRIEVPDEFDGRAVWYNFLSYVKNQGTCGGCYAYAAASVLSDRYNIRSEGELYLELSATRIIHCDAVGRTPQVIGIWDEAERVKALEEANDILACKGNTLLEAWRYLNNVGSNTVECVPEHHKVGATCTDLTGRFYDTCEALSKPGKPVPAVFWRARHIYVVPGVPAEGGSEHTMRENIFRYGPISTAMDVYENFYTFDPQKEIYRAKGRRTGGHAIVIDGWGIEDGVPFWWVRNSWGPDWGIGGYFKLVRGTNDCHAEMNVIVGAPILGSFGSLDVPQQSVDLLNLPELALIRRSVTSTFIPSGGLDSRTNISRRYLATQEFANQPYTITTLKTPSDKFIAGYLTNGAAPGSAAGFFWALVVALVVAVIVVLHFTTK